ncbi:MAG: hypothetical protein GC200_12370 [Tepidisphaera sp.]|nr:hypothetical protein [Tepidisphaera sp.]
MSHASPAAFNELDPHDASHHGQHEHHAIVGPFQLRLVLVTLLFFTFATVAFAQIEVFVEGLIGGPLPWWVNVAGAMSIAVVKSLLVMAIFMQLRYDNPMNSIIMAFTFAALAIFIVFTGIDLLGRSQVDAYKAENIKAGGTDEIVSKKRDAFLAKMVDRYGAEEGKAKYEELDHEFNHAHEESAAAPEGNTPNLSRERVGLTGALLEVAPAKGEHAEHGAAHEGAEPGKKGEKTNPMGQESEGP